MSLIREQARGILRRLVLPVPTRDRTLNVVFTPGAGVPALGHRCLCTIAVNHVWRAAHEHGCTKIVVHGGPGHKHEFDTIDFFKRWVIGRLGWMPSVFSIASRKGPKTPALLATRGHQALGNEFDTTRPTFNIPIAVSSLTAGGQEAS